MSPEERQAILTRARDLFNSGEYWRAHEALETLWRSIIKNGDEGAARAWQGLIQPPAAPPRPRRGPARAQPPPSAPGPRRPRATHTALPRSPAPRTHPQ